MDIVILDANAIVSDFWGRSAAWQVLKHARHDGHLEIKIPEMAVIESVERYRAKVTEAVAKLTSARSTLSGLDPSLDLDESGSYDVDEITDRFEQGLRNTYELVEYIGDDEEVHSWVRRAARREPPFDSKGNGFRDALIWGVVLSEVSDHEDVVFITNDGGFYMPESQDLHDMLQADVAMAGEGAEIRIYRTVRDYVQQNIARDERVFAQFATFFRGHQDEIASMISAHLLGQNYEGAAIVEVHWLYSTINTVGPVDEHGRHRVSIDASSELTFAGGGYLPSIDDWVEFEDTASVEVAIEATWDPEANELTRMWNEPFLRVDGDSPGS